MTASSSPSSGEWCECEHGRGQHDAIGNCWHVDRGTGEEDCDCDQFRTPPAAGAVDETGLRDDLAEIVYDRDVFAGDLAWSRTHPRERERCYAAADRILDRLAPLLRELADTRARTRDLADMLAATRQARADTEADLADTRTKVRDLVDELELRAASIGPQASDYDRGYAAGLANGEYYAADRLRAALSAATHTTSEEQP